MCQAKCRGQQFFSVKDQVVNTLGFVGRRVSVAMTQFCHCSVKVAKKYINT